MKSSHQIRVEKFMRQAGQPAPLTPTMPSLKTRILRARLIMKETLKTILALGLQPHVMNEQNGFKGTQIYPANVKFVPQGEPNLIAIVDGCADVIVVTTGTLSACGVHDYRVMELVDENNLMKFGTGSWTDDFGKHHKPPGHKPPDFAGELRSQGWRERETA